MRENIDRITSIYALLVDFSFFLIRKAAVPPIEEPIIVKGSGTDVAVDFQQVRNVGFNDRT